MPGRYNSNGTGQDITIVTGGRKIPEASRIESARRSNFKKNTIRLCEEKICPYKPGIRSNYSEGHLNWVRKKSCSAGGVTRYYSTIFSLMG